MDNGWFSIAMFDEGNLYIHIQDVDRRVWEITRELQLAGTAATIGSPRFPTAG